MDNLPLTLEREQASFLEICTSMGRSGRLRIFQKTKSNRRNIMVALDALTGLSVLCTAALLKESNAVEAISILLVILSVLGAFETPTVQACVPQMQTGDYYKRKCNDQSGGICILSDGARDWRSFVCRFRSEARYACRHPLIFPTKASERS